ncbi:MAG: UDP-N-acetylmuramyl pentapeptide phosphotransferase [Firmicutes bacterium]|nr:UDP-N-acetylmuramyl pentapeptide phosphotransferase [Bacillota bacterium]
MLQAVILFLLASIITYIFQDMVKKMLINAGQVTSNFKGQKIAGVMGIAIVLGAVATAVLSVLFTFTLSANTLYIAFACSLMGFIGAIDDFLGNDASKGFKGHILNLAKGNLTTGGLKIIAGGIIAFAIALQVSPTFWDILLNILLIGLVTNFINLLDTRPGRAIKGFILVTILTLLLGNIPPIHYIVLGTLAVYLPVDLKAQGMLGDTGANFIGMALGISIVIAVQNTIARLIIMMLMLGLNVLSEKYSFSKIIERNRVLRFVDDLGRK